MAAWLIEKALELALAGLKALAPGLLAKAAELLAKAAPKVVREALAQALTKLADTAMNLVHKALDFVGWSHSAVGKEVAKSAQEIADKLYEMARKLREDSSNMVQMEEGTHDAHVLALTYEVDVESMKRGIEEVEHQVEEVARLLKEHAELKVGEAGDNHPDKCVVTGTTVELIEDRDMKNSNMPCCYFVMNKMNVNFYIFGALMLHWICRHVYSADIITVDQGRCEKWGMKLTKEVANQMSQYSIRNPAIFSLSTRTRTTCPDVWRTTSGGCHEEKHSIQK
ncbi:hypothetical protein Tco_0046255 [Tanacetum coccineum]